MDILDLLSTHPLFKGISIHDLHAFSNGFHHFSAEPNEIIVRQDEMGSIIGLIQSGGADLVYSSSENDDTVLRTVGPGQFFGTLALFTEGRYLVSVVCRKAVTGWIHEFRSFAYMIEHFPQIREQLFHNAFNQIWSLHKKMNFPITQDTFVWKNTDLRADPVEHAMQYINRNYMQPLTLEIIAKECGMSKFYFSRLFKEKTGFAFKEYLNLKRIGAAKTFLKESEISITEVCYLTGYNDLSYFSRTFRKYTGSSPGQFRSDFLSLCINAV